MASPRREDFFIGEDMGGLTMLLVVSSYCSMEAATHFLSQEAYLATYLIWVSLDLIWYCLQTDTRSASYAFTQSTESTFVGAGG